MKGTATLTLDETYNERKAFILSCIVTTRGLIKAIQSTSNKFPEHKDLYNETITNQQQSIKHDLAELTELERWRVKEGMAKDEPYKYPSIRKRLADQERQQQDHAVHLNRAKELGNYDYWTPETCLECKASNND